MLVAFSALAEAEIDLAFDWYNDQSPRLGADFAAEFETLLDRLRANPLQFPAMRANIRRALFRRFPYSLLFRLEDDTVRVIACFHPRRDPRSLRGRI